MSQSLRHSNDERYRWEVLALVMLGTLMAVLDTTIVNIALPDIQAAFGSPLDSIQWVVTGYMLSFACFMPLTSWAAGRYGNKAVYIFSLAVFVIGSALCGLAWNLPSLVAARSLQALGGAAIIPIGMTMVSAVFPPNQRGKALGIWGVGVIMGPAFGPTLGGYLTETLGWRSIFTVNVPLGIAVISACAAMLRPDIEAASKDSKLDWGGFLFLAMALAGFLLGLSKGETKGWGSSFVLGCFAAGTVGTVGFLLVESLVPEPIIDLGLLKIPVFSVTLLVTYVRAVGMFSGAFLLPLFVQQQMGYSEIDAGLLMLPGALIVAFTMPIAGNLADRMGPRYLVLVGLFFMAFYSYIYRNLDASTSLWGVIYPTLIRGVGLGLLMAPVMTTALNSVPKHRIAMASMLLNLLQQVAGSSGIAGLTTLLTHRVTHHMAVMGVNLDMGTGVAQQTFMAVVTRLRELGLGAAAANMGARASLAAHVFEAAWIRAYDDAFLATAVVILLAAIPALLLPSDNPHRDHGDSHPVVME